METPSRLRPELAAHSRLALDTAPLIYFLEGDRDRAPLVREVLIAASLGVVSLVVSTLTEAELLVAPLRANDQRATSAIRALLDGSTGLAVIDVSRNIARSAASIRADHGLALPDAVVAATAIEARCTGLMGNDRSLGRLQARLAYLHVDDLIMN
ncbi:MAG: type II toxin-antitoxin system VapC family toxin [Candidatus Methylomirabilales bacterium]